MFSRARWRLTFWFAGVVTLILIVIGVAVILTARAQLFDQVNDDLRERARQNVLAPLGPGADETRARQRILEIATSGGYFYALANPQGEYLVSTSNVTLDGLPDEDDLARVQEDGAAFVDTESGEGEGLRVYVTEVITVPQGRDLLLAVGRSTEPERQALRQITIILAGGGLAGVGLAVAGGFFLSGLALRPIRRSVDRQRAFVADASHELRTPLTIVRATAELLKRDRDKPDSVDATADEIISETDRLSALVNQMLTLARSDADISALETETVDLAGVAGEVTRQMRLLAEPKAISIDVSADGPIHVEGDATRLRELVTILLDNAIKYSDERASVTVRVDRDGGRALLTVSDTGRGIPAEALPRIFDRFYRVDKARSREMGGAGLGLSIARWIVDAHAGQIRVDSVEGGGTTVRVELPVSVN